MLSCLVLIRFLATGAIQAKAHSLIKLAIDTVRAIM